MNTVRLFLVGFLFPIIPPTRGHALKAHLLRWAGAQVGKDVEIVSSAKFHGRVSLHIGDNCYIGHEALIFGAEGSSITIEDHAKVGSRVVVVTGSHRFSVDGDCIEKEGVYEDVRIGAGAAVSTGSLVLPGVNVGRMSHVAAGSVVTRDVPEYHRVAGVPARIVRDLRVERELG